MEPEEAVEVEGRAFARARARDRDRGPRVVVRLLAVRHDDVQSIDGAALEDATRTRRLRACRRRAIRTNTLREEAARDEREAATDLRKDAVAFDVGDPHCRWNPGCPGSAGDQRDTPCSPGVLRRGSCRRVLDPVLDGPARLPDRSPPTRTRGERVRARLRVRRASPGDERSTSVRVPGSLLAASCEREVQPRDERSGVDPGRGGVRVAGRRLAEVERLAHLRELARDRKRVVRSRADRARGRDDVLERRLDLGAVVLRVEELGLVTTARTVSPQVAAGLEELFATRFTSAAGGSSATKRWQSWNAMRWAVAGWRARNRIIVSPSSMPPPGGNGWPRTVFVSDVVHAPRGRRTPEPCSGGDGPARQDARELRHVLLRVAAVHAERVQLHELPRVVLVQAARGRFGFAAARSRIPKRPRPKKPRPSGMGGVGRWASSAKDWALSR